MANMQHPIIRPLVFGENIQQLIIQLTTGWLLGEITRFDKRVHTPSSSWGHYLMTHEVGSLFISCLEETLRGPLDLPRHLPWDRQRWGR